MLRRDGNHLWISIICAFLFFIVSSRLPINAQTIAPVDNTEAARWREDLRFMAQEMPKRHPNLFHAMTREQFDAAVKRLNERIPTLARHQIIVEMARIVAAVGKERDGHTSLPLVPLHLTNELFKVGFRQYPLKLYLYSDGLFVQSATPEYAGIIGARVVKIGQTSAENAFKAASDIVSRDNEITPKERVPQILAIPEVLHALGLIENMEKAGFTFESKGTQKVIELSPMADSQEIKWIDAREAVATPLLWLKDTNNNYWFEYLADSRTVYFQFNGVGDKHDGESLSDFFKRLFAFIESRHVDRFIIDMRLNRGGNGVLSWPLIYGIIRSDKINQKGKLFTIIGRRTFSAASQTAAWLGLHTKTTFVGEPTGGGVNVFGNHNSIVLPNSGIEVLLSEYFFQNTYPWDQRPWIAPQIKAELSSDDYRRNNDPALKAILNYRSIAEALMPALQANDMSLVVKQYHEFKTDNRTTGINTEGELNSLGYRLLNMNKVEQAVAIFKLNTESYPDSFNAFDSLGDAYAKTGNKDLAIMCYRRAIEINPQSEFTAHKLRELNGK